MKNVENVGERIRAIRLKEGLTQTEFASIIGVSGNRLSEYETKGDPPKSNILASIYRNFNVDALWLLTGEGSMEKKKGSSGYLSEQLNSVEQKIDFLIKRDHISTDEKTTPVPLYQHAIAAGPATDSTCPVEDYLDLPKHMISHPQETYAVRATGDSMIGAGIEEGDILIVDYHIEAQDKNIIIASVNGEQTVKRLRKDGKKTWLMPENSHYKPTEITKTMRFDPQGVVTWVIRKTA
ncbi:translesion error-prone DNA polymerase V autoproteolytic subunit [Prosthecochloris sp.]|uniref:helix-turn-helix domain-containing protein n=1 Tax=Prosthecochloris sp. TaxID=290513 RepID=UPI00257D6BD7|nr:translesion error-prone DNA polymerase V autoproteolytic subunit [Prosthecochloris sp.]